VVDMIRPQRTLAAALAWLSLLLLAPSLVLAQQVARYFCAYQIQDDFARDALLLGA